MSLDPLLAVKDRVRRSVRERMRGISSESRRSASRDACQLLAEQPVWRNARCVLLFAPLPDELNIWPLLELALAQGKTAALPKFDLHTGEYTALAVRDPGNQIQPGQFGIREPSAECEVCTANGLDLILVPGVAFDLQGNRLGRGKGFYDRWLRVLRGVTCGVCFDEQIERELPVASHDQPVNCVLTPTRWVQC